MELLRVSLLKFAIGRRPVFDLESWAVKPGEHWVIQDSSAVGISNFIALISGITIPQSGEIYLGGTALSSLSAERRDTLRSQFFSIVFRSIRLIGALTVEQNMKLSCYFSGKPWREDYAKHILDKLEIAPLRKKYASQLSVEEALFAAIARAMISRPKILVMDDPTRTLDDATTKNLIKQLMEIAEEAGSAMIVATSDHRMTSAISNRLTLNGMP